MSLRYSQRSLVVLSFLGLLSAIMSVLSVVLISQLQSQHTAVRESPPAASLLLPAPLWAALLPVSTVLCALSLSLHLSAAVVCVLHGYVSTEVCRAEEDTDRADWFLLDSRAVRHVAVGLFCMGVSVYLAAMSIFMLLIFEVETGVASACVLSSGILVLLAVVIHTLVKACRGAGDHYAGGDRLDTLFQNDHGGAGAGHSLVSRHRELKLDVDRPQHGRPRLQQQMSYPPPCGDPRPQQYQQQRCSPPGGSQGRASDKDGYSSGGSGARLHRTLSTESGLLQAQTKPWNGVNNEMRSVLARKSGISAKDSTLV